MIIVLDCNIWIGLAINKQLDVILQLSEKSIKIMGCQLESEMLDVLNRPKLKKILPETTIADIHLIYSRFTKTHVLSNFPLIVKDPKDNYLFALCKKAKADYFITGDKLLLSEQLYGKTKIISLSEFKRLLNL